MYQPETNVKINKMFVYDLKISVTGFDYPTKSVASLGIGSVHLKTTRFKCSREDKLTRIMAEGELLRSDAT